MNDDNNFWFSSLMLVIFFTLGFLIVSFWMSWVYIYRNRDNSPYTGFPLRPLKELPYFLLEKVHFYMLNYHQYDNRPFKIMKASFCRDTGRIFPDSISALGTIRVNWNFLNKRYPGDYVSWGSLTKKEQDTIRQYHYDLEGFETEFSCSHPLPQSISEEYLFHKPGPLYVDLKTFVLVGWKVVPDTFLEVLIVQKPIKPILEVV